MQNESFPTLILYTVSAPVLSRKNIAFKEKPGCSTSLKKYKAE